MNRQSQLGGFMYKISPAGPKTAMKTPLTYLRALILGSFILMSFNCASQTTLKDFSSDGCSLFPDKDYSTQSKNISWCDCCVLHDIAYWKGGAPGLRKTADSALSQCILTKTGDSTLAQIMYLGVRAGGKTIVPTWYSWGYGWSFGRVPPPGSRAWEGAIEQKGAVDTAVHITRACPD
jgi:hypothetical protein